MKINISDEDIVAIEYASSWVASELSEYGKLMSQNDFNQCTESIRRIKNIVKRFKSKKS